MSSTTTAKSPQSSPLASEAKRAAARAETLGTIVADLKLALTSIDIVGEGISQVALSGFTTDIVDPELWSSAAPKLSAATLSLSVLSARQKYGRHLAAIGRRAVESAIDITSLTPTRLPGTEPDGDAKATLAETFNPDLQLTIEKDWPEALDQALSEIPRSATMSAIDRHAREQMLAHWPVDLSGAKLATLIASKLLEEAIVRLDVQAAAVRAQRAPGGYLYIEDAGAGFYALRCLGRAGMFMAQAAVRNGAGFIPGAPKSEGFEYAGKLVCHAMRLISVKAFDLYKEQEPEAKLPSWIEPIRSAKIMASEEFNKDLLSARSAMIFKPKQGANPTQTSPGASVS